MTARALPLHEEVVAAMYAEGVDPMERTFHMPSPRRLRLEQTGETEDEENVPSYRSTNLDFWRGFNKNQKYLQAKSAADLRKTAARKEREKKKPPPKKINPLLLDRGKPTARELVQDQKIPARNLACRLPPPDLTSGGRGEKGLVYEVEELLRFARKKHGPHYRPQPLVEDPGRSTEGVVYQYHPPEKEGGEDSQRKEKETEKEREGTNRIEVEETRLGPSRESHREDSHCSESALPVLLPPHNLDANSSSLPPPFADDVPDPLFQESFTSNSLEKTSFVSGTGTVVPSLNLSAVVASQISSSHSHNQSHSQSQSNKKKGKSEGHEVDQKAAEDTDDNQTAESTFAFNENTTDNNLDQQPSFAFTDGGNEDFLFAKSILEDGTFATNTLMGDDQTKATLPTTCLPAKGGKRCSAKQRRQYEKELEAKRQLLKPTKGMYGDIGSSVKGGVMAQGPSRPPPERPVTQLCNIPTVEELEAGSRRDPKGGSFLLSSRFPSSAIKAPRGGESQGDDAVPPSALPSGLSTTGVTAFSNTKRFQHQENNHNPAPGDYVLGRMFDEVPHRLTAVQSQELVKKIEGERTLRNQSCNFMATQAVFGYGCSVQEHIKYGLCLDGLCGRRAKWEDVTLLAQDRDRLGHGGGLRGEGFEREEQSSPQNKSSKNKSKSSKKLNSSSKNGKHDSGTINTPPSVSVTMRMSKRAQASIEDLRHSLHCGETPDYSPLKTASLRGDFDTIVQLCLLGADINERDRLKETVLHQAVMRNYLHIIVCLTEVQGYSECLNDKLKDICRTRSRGMFLQGAKHALELNAQDHKGNTPLHIAAIRGNCLMAEVLCDAGVTPDGIRNNEGRTASDVAKTQRLFQIIKMAQNKYEARQELSSLRRDRRERRNLQRSKGRDTLQQQDLQRREEGGEDTEEVPDYEVFEEEVVEVEEEEEEEEEVVMEKEREEMKGNVKDEVKEEMKGGGDFVLPVSKKHTDLQHSYHVSYFGSPQVFKKKQSEREKYARFLNMRR